MEAKKRDQEEVGFDRWEGENVEINNPIHPVSSHRSQGVHKECLGDHDEERDDAGVDFWARSRSRSKRRLRLLDRDRDLAPDRGGISEYGCAKVPKKLITLTVKEKKDKQSHVEKWTCWSHDCNEWGLSTVFYTMSRRPTRDGYSLNTAFLVILTKKFGPKKWEILYRR